MLRQYVNAPLCRGFGPLPLALHLENTLKKLWNVRARWMRLVSYHSEPESKGIKATQGMPTYLSHVPLCCYVLH